MLSLLLNPLTISRQMRQPPVNTTVVQYQPQRRMSRASPFAEESVIKDRVMASRTIVSKSPSWTPNYAAVRKSGRRLKPLDYSHTKIVDNFQLGNRRVVTRWGPDTWVSETRTGACPWVGSSPALKGSFAGATAKATTKAVTKFLLQLKDSKFNGVQAYAEADQVYRMVSKFAETTAKALVHLRRGRLKAAAGVVGLTVSERQATRYRRQYRDLKGPADIDKMLANGVLAIQYGVRPLINDVIGAAELYAQKRCSEVINQTRSSGSYEFSDDWSFSDASGLKQTARYVVRAQVTYASTFGKGSEVLHTAKQLGITNPLLIAWELMPWSFVIDWVLPVGNYLSSIDATLGLNFVDGYKSVKVSSSEIWNQTIASPLPSKGNGTGTHEVSSTSTFRTEFHRTVLTAFPMPELPNFKNPLSWEHALNGVALLAGFKKTVYLKQPVD